MASNKDLPQDMRVEILARLPVKSLMRFKCLSKPSSALITSAYFINKHFQFSSELARNQHALLIIYYGNVSPCWNPTPRMRLISDEIFDAKPFDVELPILGEDGFARPAVQGPCNGVFCIMRSRLLPLILWNPATKEKKVLPFSQSHPEGTKALPFSQSHPKVTKVLLLSQSHPKETKVLPFSQCHPFGIDSVNIIGFGIDPKTNDFKIVSISSTKPDFRKNINERSRSLVEVYNLSSNSWKTIVGTVSPFDLASPNFNSYLNGVYHWKSYGKNNITCFDMSKEVFWRMEIPGCLKGSDSIDWHIAVIDDCVACIKGPSNLTDSSAEIWIMSEYGVQESWTRRYKLAPDSKDIRCRWRHNSTIDSVLEWMASCYPLTKEKELEVLIYASELLTASQYAESLFPLSVLE